jgi:predicted ATPase
MITSISLRNFKAFGEKDESFRLAPITLVYGPNSAGKSSVLQALKVVAQSFDSSQREMFDPKGIGSFRDLVHNHDLKRRIGINITFDRSCSNAEGDAYFSSADAKCTYRWVYVSQTGSFGGGKLEELEIWPGIVRRFKIGKFKNNMAEMAIDWHKRRAEEELCKQLKAKDSFRGDESYMFELLEQIYFSAGIRFGPGGAEIASKFESQSKYAVNQSPMIAPFVGSELASHWNLLKRSMNQCRFIGPQRRDPRKAADLGDVLDEIAAKSDYVGEEGENLENVLYSNEALREDLNRWLDDGHLCVGYRVHLKENAQVGKSRLVLVNRAGVESSLRHVGYGLSQLLPILAQAIVGKNQTVVIEQPELHIHPKLQAEVGDLLMETIKPPHSNQYIVETHSETLALRLQRRIREGKLPCESVSILYVDPQGSQSTVLPLRLDELGNFIDEWPDGFFEESYEEVFG